MAKKTAEELWAEIPVEFLSATEVARYFHTTPAKLRGAIENGTLPIGFSCGDERCVIVKNRLEAYIEAWDQVGQFNLNRGIKICKRKEAEA